MKLNESEKARIRKLHKSFSLIKEQDSDVEMDITKDFSLAPDSLEGDSKPKAKMGANCGELHVFTMCGLGGNPVVPTASGIPSSAPCAQISSGSIPFYSMVGSPSPGQVVFVTGYGGAGGGQWCLKYVGIKNDMSGLSHAPLDINGANIQYIQSYNNCSDCTVQMRDYDCFQDGSVHFCNDVNWGTGQYSGPTALQDCQAQCGNQGQTEYCTCCDGSNALSMATPVPIGTCNSANFGPQYTNCVPASGPMPICSQQQEYCVNCSQGWMMPIALGQPCPQGTVNVGTNPNPPSGGPCIECVQQVCTQTSNGWSFGPNSYNSLADCQNSPTCQPGNTFDCVNGSCQSAGTSGAFPNLAACQAQCGNTYDCIDWTSPSGCQSAGAGGQFATLDDCLVSPCQCDSIIMSWPFYLNNPNNPQGNWDGSPSHDGPSNPNALSQILTNVQNSNAYTSTNPVQLHKAKCREAAILHWQANSGPPMPCCDDANFAVGAATSDPLGCVTTSFINNTMTNFMNNHAGWPGQGCQWLNNALANATTQQANFQPGTGGYCKTQGKINFINNFKTTGNSAYLSGQAVFTLPCI